MGEEKKKRKRGSEEKKKKKKKKKKQIFFFFFFFFNTRESYQRSRWIWNLIWMQNLWSKSPSRLSLIPPLSCDSIRDFSALASRADEKPFAKPSDENDFCDASAEATVDLQVTSEKHSTVQSNGSTLRWICWS